MSFLHNGSSITLDNYKSVFSGYSPDVLDEIRSAILDDTPISSYIEPCSSDSYKLNQLRLARRELVDIDYLDTRLTGKTIYYIRQAHRLNVDISIVLLYANKKALTLPSEIIEKLAKAQLDGIEVSKVNFRLVPYALVDLFCSGLEQGYPMWLFLDDKTGCPYSEDRIRLLMRGMKLGIDVQPFLTSGWVDTQISLLLSNSARINLNDILCYINYHFSNELLTELVDLVGSGIDIRRLCVTDDENYPIYSSFQVHELGIALKQGCATEQMFNPNISDMEITNMRLANQVTKKELHKHI